MHNMNLWDAFSPRELEDRQSSMLETRLFGNRNIGKPEMTNTVVAGQMSGDMTGFVMNWYARTNVMDALDVEDRSPLARAWHAFRHATLVTLLVGIRPVAQRPLADLMGPRHGFGGDGDLIEWKLVERAERAYDAYRHHKEPTATLETKDRLPFWEELDANGVKLWHDIAASFRPFYCPVIIPVRQTFGVTIQSEQRALCALLELMPKNVAPRTLIWVHLDGVLSRDVG